METEIPQRLAAIVAADIAGYTRLMERNEAGTVAAWRRARAEVIDPTVAACRGRIVKLTGDGFLAEFPTAESAINAVLAMQAAFTALFGDPHAEHCVAFRMGVNLGDIWVDADDIYGAGVNVAARLESLAEPGGVCISGAVHDAVKHKIAARYEDLGLQRVKNVAEPIRAWRLRSAEPAATTVVSHADRAPRKLGGYLITAVFAGGLATGIYWFLSRDTDRQWLFDEAVPKIEKNIDAGDWEAAYVAATQAEERTPGAPELAELWKRFSWRVTIPSDPSGAMVYRRAYDAPETAWEALGRTPIKDKRIPFGLSRLRFELDGYLTLDRAIGTGIIVHDELPTSDSANTAFTIGTETFKLDTASTLPEDMVRVPAWHEVVNGADLAFNDFLLDRYEVTNAEYKTFVDAGGYRRERLWDPIMRDGVRVPWDEALFTDKTGRPGPSTWEAGDYPDGQAEFPVSGVSWYEAAAYARFMNQELPTTYHWRRALDAASFRWELPVSNLEGKGPRSVRESNAMSFVGAFDLAGNVREWTATPQGDQRLILGGSYNDPNYVPANAFAAPPLDRSPGNGFRLAIIRDDAKVASGAHEPVKPLLPTQWPQPVTDEIFAAYSRIFSYQRTPLNASLDAAETTRLWTRQRVTFGAAYGGERMVLYLYLPTNGSPPYQTVVYWPGGPAGSFTSIEQYPVHLDFVLKNGRAVAFPIYKGTFERGGGSEPLSRDAAIAIRDRRIQQVNDLRRSIDYLETRSDIDPGAIAFFGYSWGAAVAPAVLSHEPRLRAAILYAAYLDVPPGEPEIASTNALPRVGVPTLLLNGEFDVVPLENSKQFFALLGTPPRDKKHVVTLGGHFVPQDVLMRDTLDWLDRYLGAPRELPSDPSR